MKFRGMKMQGRKRSKVCEHCSHHPTKRVYIKVNGIFKGVAWVCVECRSFTWDDGGKFIT